MTKYPLFLVIVVYHNKKRFENSCFVIKCLQYLYWWCNFLTNKIENICKYFNVVFLRFSFIGRLTLVGQRSMKSLLSVRPSVRPSLSFLTIESLISSDIVHGDSWPRNLITDGARFFGEKKWLPKFGKWAKMRPKIRFSAIFSSLGH